MGEFLVGSVIGAISTALIVIGMSGLSGTKMYDYNHAKEECEQHLPRDQECEIKFIVVQGE